MHIGNYPIEVQTSGSIDYDSATTAGKPAVPIELRTYWVNRRLGHTRGGMIMAQGAHIQQRRTVTQLIGKDVTPLRPEDWRLAQTSRVNLLLIGMDGAMNEIVDALLRDSRELMTTWQPGEHLVLPPVTQLGTMILHDVGALVLADQRRLLDWSQQAAGRTRVISTTSAPLLPLIEIGAFSDRLYYRLNTICLERA